MPNERCEWSKIEKFLKHPLYPGQFEVCTERQQSNALGLPIDLKKFYVHGSPIECTLECDYSTINVSGNDHRLYIIGLRNQINLCGNSHHIYCEGFHNIINFCTNISEGQICVQGDSSFAFKIGVSNGTVHLLEEDIKFKKLTFPSSLKEKRRRRLMWKPANELETEDSDCTVDDDDDQKTKVNSENGFESMDVDTKYI